MRDRRLRPQQYPLLQGTRYCVTEWTDVL